MITQEIFNVNLFLGIFGISEFPTIFQFAFVQFTELKFFTLFLFFHKLTILILIFQYNAQNTFSHKKLIFFIINLGSIKTK